MNQAKLKTYPMQTTPAIPGAVRLPNTLHEHFRADPMGATSFKQWREDRIREFLQRPARGQRYMRGKWESSPANPVWELGLWIHCGMRAHEKNPHARIRVILLDGAVIKEWLPETKDSASVDKT